MNAVTTEDDFQNKLDEHPDDWQTRLVFADWLEERADPRAEGYRALASCRYVLCDRYPGNPPRYLPRAISHIFLDDGRGNSSLEYSLPLDWYEAIPERPHQSPGNCIPHADRRDAENSAALAFAKLPAKRRAQLLAGRGEAKKKPKAAKRKNVR